MVFATIDDSGKLFHKCNHKNECWRNVTWAHACDCPVEYPFDKRYNEWEKENYETWGAKECCKLVACTEFRGEIIPERYTRCIPAPSCAFRRNWIHVNTVLEANSNTIVNESK